MKFLLFLAFLWCCSAQLIQPNLVVLPHTFAQQYRGQDAFGQATFGHFSFDQAQQQTRLADGSVIGYYSYIDAEGKPAVTTYEAGRKGFRVTGSNILPEGPEVPVVPELKAPTPVEDTDEVRRAKEEFQKKFDEATSSDRVRRSVQIPIPYIHPVATVTKQKFETQQFEPVDANTPADTKKFGLTTKEHEITVPAIKYVQPVVGVKPFTYAVSPVKPVTYAVSPVKPVTYTAVSPNTPITYSAASPAVLPYTFPYAHAFPFQTHFPIVTVKTEED